MIAPLLLVIYYTPIIKVSIKIFINDLYNENDKDTAEYAANLFNILPHLSDNLLHDYIKQSKPKNIRKANEIYINIWEL